jgi:hypothetical protein
MDQFQQYERFQNEKPVPFGTGFHGGEGENNLYLSKRSPLSICLFGFYWYWFSNGAILGDLCHKLRCQDQCCETEEQRNANHYPIHIYLDIFLKITYRCFQVFLSYLEK